MLNLTNICGTMICMLMLRYNNLQKEIYILNSKLKLQDETHFDNDLWHF